MQSYPNKFDSQQDWIKDKMMNPAEQAFSRTVL